MVKAKQHLPPQLARRFLMWFLREDLKEEVEGDLEEKFYIRLEQHSLVKAKLNYWYQVLHYLRPFAIRKSTYNPNHYNMYRSYFKIGWRNLSKQKMYSSIKIGGLALGIAACMLIALFIKHELSYDQHIPDVERVYRVVAAYNQNGELLRGIHFPAPMADALEDDFPEVEVSGRFLSSELFGAGSKEVRPADVSENTHEEDVIYADQELLEIFQPQVVYGDLSHALDQPNTIAISKSKADQYFPQQDPLGKTLIFNDDESNPYKIGAVYEDFPSTSHFQYDFLLTMKGVEFWPGEQTYWGANNYYTYVKVITGTDPEVLEDKFTEGIVKKYILESMLNAGRADAEEFIKQVKIELQPVADTHLYSSGIQDRLSHGDIRFVWLFGAIAAFILILACINFVNLSTAKSANRAMEVGLRKVVGSRRSNLIRQFLTESLLFSLLAFLLSILLAQAALPFFNELSGKPLSIPWGAWWLFPLLLSASFVVGMLAGVYPSFYLSQFKPAQVIKGGLSRGSKSSKMRSALVIFQFTTSIVLIIGTFIIYRQMDFILNKEVGYDKEQIILLEGANTLGEQVYTLKDELLKLSEVEKVTISDYLPIKGTKRNQNPFWQKGRQAVDNAVGAQIWRVDADYIQTMGMDITQGRDFNPQMPTDSQAVIINQRMMQELGLNDPIGNQIVNSGGEAFDVIGVVDNFNFETLKEDVRPLCLVLGNSTSIVSLKVNSENMQGLIDQLTQVWNQFSPNQSIRYAFLNESFAMMYSDVQRMGRIFTSFAILAIIVACLGLFALSAFMVEQRSKEISIRLVLGASLNSIFKLLTQNFLLLILISLVLAIPIAWYMMQQWLQDYEYRIEIGWDIFLLAGLMAVLIALLTISYQSIKAALINPAESLRSE